MIGSHGDAGAAPRDHPDLAFKPLPLAVRIVLTVLGTLALAAGTVFMIHVRTLRHDDPE